MPFKFEKLEIWRDGMKLVNKIYDVTKKYPAEERFALIDQIRRAVTSIVLNIAEGSTQRTNKEFVAYLIRSLGSLYEVVTALYIARNRQYMIGETFSEVYDQADQLGRRINSLIDRLKNG